MDRRRGEQNLVLLGLFVFATVFLTGLLAPHLPRAVRWAEHRRIVVVDGDTVRLPSGDRVRLLGIDAPEMPPGARCEAEAELALAARDRLRELIRRADEITYATGRDDRDRYGRSLRYVYVDGVDAGGVLMREGLAKPWTGRHASWC